MPSPGLGLCGRPPRERFLERDESGSVVLLPWFGRVVGRVLPVDVPGRSDRFVPERAASPRTSEEALVEVELRTGEVCRRFSLDVLRLRSWRKGYASRRCGLETGGWD